MDYRIGSQNKHRSDVRLLTAAVSCLLSLVFLTGFAAAQKRAITEKDIFDFVWVGDPQVSPDGSRAAFVKVTVNPAKTNYDTSIWVVATAGNEEPRRITTGTRDTSPRWSPDGKYRIETVRGVTGAQEVRLVRRADGDIEWLRWDGRLARRVR